MLALLKNQNLAQKVLRNDVIVGSGVVMILMVMIIPLPSLLLDLFLTLNITVSLVILIIALYTTRTLDFSSFPSLLLATTLFRLSLNVASTRLILLHGHEGADAAGTVIKSFGQFVVGGNYVVGIVIFCILVVINFMVITKGAGRVAEVAARFTLDAMPGKQMAIDADLNAGLIDEETARSRRKEIAEESDFYGAMDGASKFVRGDAIAGIIITLVNIGAGFVIGVLQNGMPAVSAAQTYTILTVGDGLVGQVPALIISTGAGILVTRAAGSRDFGTALKGQLTLHPRALWLVSGILLVFAMIPGLPHIPFVLISIVLGFIAFQVQKTRERSLLAEAETVEDVEERDVEVDFDELLHVDLLELEVGYGLIPLVDSNQEGELLPRIQAIRKQFAMDMGFIIPPVHIKDNLQLTPNQYSILLKGVKVGVGEVFPGQYLAMDPGTATEVIKGIETTEPAFGLPAVWISEDKKDRAQIAGYTVVDCATVMSTHLSEVIKNHAHELLGRQEVQNLLNSLSKTCPKLVEDLVPDILNIGLIMRVMQNLLKEHVSIRDIRTVLETMADYAPHTQDAMVLTEYVRGALARSISDRYAVDGKNLNLITLDREIEETLHNAIHTSQEGSYLALEPGLAHNIIERLSDLVAGAGGGNVPVLLTAPTIRPHVKRLTERYLPQLVVLSHNEIAPQMMVRSLGTVSLNAG
ncbi:flagellar biosynthesis protein FlhA [Geothermobacter hydrogeniphilus]|uniref:Flagellar biosynthesis protein FlhA n=1 Tax=Geothermobacter hydrogeniphilus TaxID=1969733 RepID=A0A2K2HCV1_9BACT|nr:flagellar biosynthesis protein FlhA [Geothermobacter hydrogeniphilus]PNU21135.1 flagellar biosynthesis protein FlhA [Geothermobacter hydrogeniphilus]